MGKRPRNYEVVTREGTQYITAHFMFDDDSGGILFRRYNSDNPKLKTEIVGKFAAGYWLSVREVQQESHNIIRMEEHGKVSE